MPKCWSCKKAKVFLFLCHIPNKTATKVERHYLCNSCMQTMLQGLTELIILMKTEKKK